MAQNRSHAVMQQRAEAHDSLDDFPTPPWAARALVEHVIAPTIGGDVAELGVLWEPASNRGYLARGLSDYFRTVHCSDIHDYSEDAATVLCQDRIVDFLWPDSESPVIVNRGVDWIITNPPFRLAEQFYRRAAEIKPRAGIALLVRTSFLEGVGRYRELFKPHPPLTVAQFTERVPMVKGRLDKKASTATSYCWLVWAGVGGALEWTLPCRADTAFEWIPPCRKQLERDGDYPDVV